MKIPRLFSRQPRAPWQIILMIALIMAAIWVPIAEAMRARTNGAGGCGQFKDAVEAAEDMDIITPMFDSNEGRNSEGATITQDIFIEGGWSPGNGCDTVNITYNTPAEMLAAGFTYGGPKDRGALDYPGGNAPIVTVGNTVKDLLLYAMDFHIQQNQGTHGGGMFGTNLSAANLRFDQVGFLSDPNGADSEASVSGNGGGLSLDIANGSRVTMRDVVFSDLEANNGGGFELTVRGNSQVTLNNVQVVGNTANGGNGGGGRIIMHSGIVTITDSVFSGNTATGEGGALRIERAAGATGTAEVWIINTRFTGNNALVNSDLSVSGNVVVRNLLRSVALPVIATNKTPGAQIESVTRTGTNYSVAFNTSGFQPALSGQHVHFFFDTVPPTQAGVPGTGPWFNYGGASPFTLWGVANRPFGATRICILVANSDHSVIQNTGNCVKLS
jgi:hypothetical protein